jgi:hypothetical protein
MVHGEYYETTTREGFKQLAVVQICAGSSMGEHDNGVMANKWGWSIEG